MAFIWNLEYQQIFDILCTALTTSPIIRYPNFLCEFIIQTDASHSAIGAVLSQVLDDREEHPVVYCSHTLNLHKHNYTVTKYECLAVIYTCK